MAELAGPAAIALGTPLPAQILFLQWFEAVEASIKMARLFTKRQNIICMQGARVPRTHVRRYGYDEEQDDLFRRVPPTHARRILNPLPILAPILRSPPPSTPTPTLSSFSLAQLDLLLEQQTAPSDTAAILVEPVLGEGGYVPAPPEFLQGLRERCDKHGMMLIVDEVQSGVGRTGAWFAVEENGVRPDIMVIAKGLGNGFPISGVVSRRELTDKLVPGSMGGTYASCAAAVAVNKVMCEENILENVNTRSHEFFSALNALKYDPFLKPHILDVRGRGLMVGVEFASPSSSDDKSTQHPKNMAARVAKKCIEKGMLLLTTSVYEVGRFIPPLNVNKEDMKKGCAIFAESVREVVKEG
ncbi:hypothetical protein GALMADRAFT_154508 [Galerina marginata CBS 339.88]|uniref:Uncharacterized protein n=1 Tax=Galerina marginata (strain CBS 339.88) TaxID=685588 RepID=A0A067TF22_GALM3|nr:hypothetical protein GALMADRAFT_154508 [Galerina marginata CBS 339.88]